MPGVATLEAVGLSKKYGEQIAVHPLDLAIDAGQVMALLGSNGAGKTTTVHMFMGFVTPSSGSACVDGIDVQKEPRLARGRLGYLPENLALYPHLTGLENLRYFGELGGERRADGELRAQLEAVGFPVAFAERKAGAYSKGMRQKVGLAIALGRPVKALLLDEPLSGLDPKASNDLSKVLRRLASEGTAILMATHDIFRAKSVADRIGIMRDGRLVASLDSQDVTVADVEARYLAEMGA